MGESPKIIQLGDRASGITELLAALEYTIDGNVGTPLMFIEPSREAAEMRIERSFDYRQLGDVSEMLAMFDRAAAGFDEDERTTLRKHAFGDIADIMDKFTVSARPAAKTFAGVPWVDTWAEPRRPITGAAKTKIIKARKAERQRKKRARTRNKK